MTTEQANTSTPAETGITTDQAAAKFEALLTGDNADTQEHDEPQEHAEHEHDDERPGTPDEDEHDAEQVDEHEEETEHDEQASQTVEIDGKPITLDEVKRGYLRQSDYTRKTTELATARQALSQEVAETQKERATYAQALEQANALLNQLKPQEPDWNALYQADPAQYAAMREMWRSYQEQTQAVEQQKQIVAQRSQQDTIKAQKAFVDAQRAKLHEALPAWSDSKVATKERNDILEWGRANGFSDDELGTIADHRAIVTMRKAMLFDRAQATRAALKPNTTGNPSTGKVRPAAPGAQATRPSSTSDMTRAKQRLARTGKVADAAAAIEMLL